MPTAFTLVVLCFGAAALQAPPATADSYTVVYGTPPLNPPRFPLSVVGRAGGSGDRWTGNVILIGPRQTGKAGRWEVRNALSNVLVYEAEGWDGTGFCDFARVLPVAPPACRVAVFP